MLPKEETSSARLDVINAILTQITTFEGYVVVNVPA